MPPHGADPAGLYREFDLLMPADASILDFSTNTNVVPWDGDLSFDIERLLSRYPDPNCAELTEILAAQNGCSEGNVLVTNGSNEAVYLIASHFAGQRAFFLDPTYGEYRRACAAYRVEEVSETSKKFGGDLNFVCNPCNPTGGYIGTAELEAIAAADESRCLVIDEAYVDFLRAAHRQIRFLEYPNILILRSLTKIFHLCGARIGYVLGAVEWIKRLKSRQPSWSVNTFAQEACKRFLNDPGFVQKTRNFYETETPRFAGMLKMRGLEVMPTGTNFFLVRTRDDESAICALLGKGIVVRHTRNFVGLDGRFIRVATRLPEENDRFAQAVGDLKSRFEEGVF